MIPDLTADEISAIAQALGLEIRADEAVEVAHNVNALRDSLDQWEDVDLSAVTMRLPFFQAGDPSDG